MLPSDEAHDTLGQLRALGAELGAEALVQDADALAERVTEGRFFVACIGQFKRGKSSLLNALVGVPVLPTGIIPVTAVPTVLRYGPTLTARVRLRTEGWCEIPVAALEDYVSEDHNPENRRGVEAAEVWIPSPVLAGGLCLVDTPGIGSVFAGNTTTTRDFLPHIDVALVVVGVDPPLVGDELALIEAVAQATPTLLIVLNKADRFTAAERATAIAFTRRVLMERLQRPIQQIFEVSALEQLPVSSADAPESPHSTDGCSQSALQTRDWDQLLETLQSLARTSGWMLVAAAAVRGITRLINECVREIDTQRDTLTQPIAASEARLETLGRCVHDAAQHVLALGDLFTAEQRRLGDRFAERRHAFLEEALPKAYAELDAALTCMTDRWGPTRRAHALATARTVGRRYVEPWLAEEQRTAEEAYRTIADRFVTMANNWLAEVAQSGNEDLEHLPSVLTHDAGFRVPSRYVFREILPLVYGSPVQTLLDIVRPSAVQRRIVQRDARAYLSNLLSMNTTLVQNDLDQRVTESRQRLAAELQTYLRRVYELVERALARARVVHAAGEQAIQFAVKHLHEQRQRALALCPRRR